MSNYRYKLFSFKIIIFIALTCFTQGCSKSDSPTAVAAVPPDAPTLVTGVAGNTQAIISFTAPTNTGGAPIINYIVTSIPGNLTASGLKSPITITGLTNGTSYTFTVIATNSAGIGATSSTSNTIIPTAGTVVSSKSCSVTSMSRFNAGNNKSDYAMTVFYDFVNRPVRMILYDSLRKVKEYEASFVYQSDAIKIDQYQFFKIDPTTQQIRTFITKSDLSNPKSDDYIYEYQYNDSGYLIVKYIYINGSSNPVYKTTYSYDNNNLLTSCLMILASSNIKILESTISYEASQSIKSFIYTFPDGFESYIYSPIFNYGKKMKYPLKTMITKIYDLNGNKLLDTWSSNFSGYTYSADGYVLTGVHSGDLQQGFGLFYGKTSFSYLCQ